MFHTTSDHYQFFFEIKGNKNAEQTLIFLNGISQSTYVWNLMTPHFEKDFQIIVCDFIFQGQSDKHAPGRDFDEHAADVYGLLNSLGVKSATVAGISYGSLVAQHFAVNYPHAVEKLILLSTFAHKTAYYNAIELAWERTLDVGGFGLMLDVMLPTVFGENYFENPLIPIESLKEMRQTINQDPAPLKKLMLATKFRKDYREQLKKIKKPSLIIHGEKDFLLLPHMGQAVADAIAGSYFKLIPAAGHTLNVEAVPQVVTLLLEFIT